MMSGSCWSHVLYFMLLFLNLHSLNATDTYRRKRFSTNQVCNETNADLVIVNSCPKNTITFEKKAKEKKCETKPKCFGKTLVYHCVKFKENLVEVCAPSSTIIGSCCAVFDRGVWRVVEDYSKPCANCPFKYQSPDCFNYDTCVKTKKTYQTTQLIYHITTSNSFSNDEGSKHNVDGGMEPSSQNILIILATTAATIAVGCLAFVFCYRRHTKGFKEYSAYEKGCPEEIDDQPLTVNRNVNSEPT